MNKLLAVLAVFALAVSPAIGDAFGQGRGQGVEKDRRGPPPGHQGRGPQGSGDGGGRRQGFHGRADGPITDYEIGIARHHYRHHVRGCRNLPPGIRRNLARGKRIPPGLRRRCRAAGYIVEHLPHRPGYSYFIIGGGLAVVNSRSWVIVDIRLGIF